MPMRAVMAASGRCPGHRAGEEPTKKDLFHEAEASSSRFMPAVLEGVRGTSRNFARCVA